MSVTILQGDCLKTLAELPEKSVHCCVTSPPYWHLRSYLPADHPLKPLEIGQEKTPAEYVAKIVAVFGQVKRVLRDDGTAWVNLGDSYASDAGKRVSEDARGPKQCTNRGSCDTGSREVEGLRPKNLVGIPWRVAFALQEDGWYLRGDIIWAKPSCMPESVADRPTRSHEYIFLLAKSERYYYDAEAIKEPCSDSFANDSRWKTGSTTANAKDGYESSKAQNPKRVHRMFDKPAVSMRNRRTVWTVPTACYSEAHFATFPPDLVKPCVLAGCPTGGTVLDPFGGSGTVGQVATELGRKAILCELNPEYIPLIKDRTNITQGLPI